MNFACKIPSDYLSVLPLAGGAGVRASGHLPPGSPAERGSQGSGDFLHHPLHRLLQES